MTPVELHWHSNDNFGDALSPWLIRKISRREVVHVAPTGTSIPLVAIGSLLGPDLTRGVIWGSGAAWERDVNDDLPPPSLHFEILATRGPLSFEAVQKRGHEPRAYGDPGLLLAHYANVNRRSDAKAGVICHQIDEEPARRFAARAGMPFLHTFEPIDVVLDALASWDVVISSCLHGLVTATAFGKSMAWCAFSDRMVGDGFKFRDFFASVGVAEPRCSRIETWSDLLRAERQAHPVEPFDTSPLLGCCPVWEHPPDF